MALQPEKWLTNYGDYLFSLAMVKTNNKETAEDLVQDCFFSAIKSKESFRGESSERTWLVSILNNKIIDYYRKKSVLKNTDSYLVDTEQAFMDNFFQNNNFSDAHWNKEAFGTSWSSKADDELNESEFQRVLLFCLAKLPPKLSCVFTSKFIDDQDSDSVCKELGLSSSNFWVIIHRAKLAMRGCLQKNWL